MTIPRARREHRIRPLPPGDPGRITPVTRIIWADTDHIPPGKNAMLAYDEDDGSNVIVIREGLAVPVRRAEVRRLQAEIRGLGATRLAASSVLTADGLRRLGLSYLRMRAVATAKGAGAAIGAHLGAAAATTAVVLGAAGGAAYIAHGGPGGPAFHSPRWYQMHPVHVTLPGRPLGYLGAYEPDSPSRYSGPGETMETFAATCGRQPNLAVYYSGWYEPFRTQFADEAAAHGAIPLVQINPEIEPGNAPVDLDAIADGSYDGYLTSFADQVSAYGRAVVIGFGHEMNGGWYPWGYGHQSALAFVAAWRHVVSVFRRQGADNVTWLWTVNVVGGRTGALAAYWPGAGYVTWVGIDGYYRHPDDTWGTIFAPTINQIQQVTHAPELIAETAIGPLASEAWQLGDMYASIRNNNDLGLVWFDEDRDGERYRLEGNTAANRADIAVFRQQTQAWRLAHQRGRS